MAWYEANAVNCIFGLPGNAVLSPSFERVAHEVQVRRHRGPAAGCKSEQFATPIHTLAEAGNGGMLFTWDQ